MKKTVLRAAAFVSMSALIVSCSEQNAPEINVPTSGTEVNFGASLKSENTRTYYGTPTDSSFPVYWGDGTANHPLDTIYVYSPQCVPGRNGAGYLVNVSGTQTDTSTKITKTGDYGVQWGEDVKTDFYGVYPASSVREASGNKMTLNIGYAQRAKAIVTNSTEGNSKNATYVAVPDMKDAVMTAFNSVDKPTDDAISLAFQPVATVLDITINGYEGNLNISHVIRSIQITSDDAQIIGNFEADFSGVTSSTDKPIFTGLEPNAEQSRSLTVTFQGGDPELKSGESLNVKAFLLPTDLLGKNITLTIGTSRGAYKKILNTTDIKPGQINQIVLPKLTQEGTIVKAADWMTYFNPATYLTDLTLPGACHSFSTSSQGSYSNATNHLAHLYNSGIRAFQFQVTESLSLEYVSNYSMSNVLDELITLMADHPMEVVYLQFSCTKSGSQEFPRALRNLVNQPKYNDKVVTGVTAETCLGEVAGKIILKTNGDNDGYFPTNNQVPALVSLFEYKGNQQGAYAKFPIDQQMQWGTSAGLTYGNTAGETGSADGMHWCYIEADNLEQCPANTWAAAIAANMRHATAYYNQGLHNYWFYTTVGLSDGASNISSITNFIKQITDYMDSDSYQPTPLGLVMMNYAYTMDADGNALSKNDPASTTGSAGLIQRLINNNSAFRLRLKPGYVAPASTKAAKKNVNNSDWD